MFYPRVQVPGRSPCYQVVGNSSDRHPAAQIDRSSVDHATETQGRRFFSAIERGLVDRQPLHLGFSDHPRRQGLEKECSHGHEKDVTESLHSVGGAVWSWISRLGVLLTFKAGHTLDGLSSRCLVEFVRSSKLLRFRVAVAGFCPWFGFKVMRTCCAVCSKSISFRSANHAEAMRARSSQ